MHKKFKTSGYSYSQLIICIIQGDKIQMADKRGPTHSQSMQIQLLNCAVPFQFRQSQVVTKPTFNSYNLQDKTKSANKLRPFNEYNDDNYTETERRFSHVSAASTVKKFKKNLTTTINSQQSRLLTQIKQTYDIWDLTYTLIQSKMKTWISAVWFFTFLAVRVYTICCCVYISLNSVHVEWLIPFLLVRVMFFILVIKISLNDPTTKTQVVLKTHWNSIQNNTREYFQVTSLKKLGISILRGLIPAQLSFFYIKSQSIKKRYQIFTAINFIFVSMEEIVFYPFFIIYCSILVKQKTFSHDQMYQVATIVIISGGFLVFIILSIYLVLLGIKKKYGGIMYMYTHYRRELKFTRIKYDDIEQENRRMLK